MLTRRIREFSESAQEEAGLSEGCLSCPAVITLSGWSLQTEKSLIMTLSLAFGRKQLVQTSVEDTLTQQSEGKGVWGCDFL